MTRVKISLFIMALLVVTSFFSGVYINSGCEKLLNRINAVQELSSQGDTADAINCAQLFSREWSKFRKTASAMVKSDKLSEIDRISARIIPLIKEQSDEVSADLKELEALLNALKNGEMPSLRSIF
ncbi:MAG: DUF4363 family protein [Ruminococcus sp.]|nr:DUF4363 family protein [Ruminococcus sp.]MBR6791730.1 DUF4363 family protein [Ruminococcus sp.]